MLYQAAAYPMRPSGKCQPGSRALLETMLYLTPGLINSGCYNPRVVAGSTTVSLHAEGRAIDVRPGNFKYKPGQWLYEGPARALTEWCHFLASHPETGVQQIIYAGRVWRTGRGWRALSTSANQHYDHAHIELTWDAALSLTPERITAALFPPQPVDPSPTPVPDPEPDPVLEENPGMELLFDKSNYRAWISDNGTIVEVSATAHVPFFCPPGQEWDGPLKQSWAMTAIVAKIEAARAS